MYNIYAIYILMQISIYIYSYTQKRLSRQSSEKGSKWSHSEKINKKKLEKHDSNSVLMTNLKIKALSLNLPFQWGNFSRIFFSDFAMSYRKPDGMRIAAWLWIINIPTSNASIQTLMLKLIRRQKKKEMFVNVEANNAKRKRFKGTVL